MAMIGYARVSTLEQNLDLQLGALQKAGCAQIFEDLGISATAHKRPGFDQALAHMSEGDVFVVWKMDRAFRSLKNALEVLEVFEQRKIEFCCLTEQIDTTTPMGKCMFQVRGAFAELEKNFIRERTIAGMNAAKEKGKTIGRPRKLSPDKITRAKDVLTGDEKVTIRQLAMTLKVHPRTLSRALGNTC